VGSRWRRRARRQSFTGDGRQLIWGTDEQGDFEVRAWIQAELLGIRLLTVKSHVVTGEPRSFRRASPAAVRSDANGSNGRAATPKLGVPLDPASRSAQAGQTRQTRRLSNRRSAGQGVVLAASLLSRCTHTLDGLSRKGDPRDQ
jgi:hypothetical protein